MSFQKPKRKDALEWTLQVLTIDCVGLSEQPCTFMLHMLPRLGGSRRPSSSTSLPSPLLRPRSSSTTSSCISRTMVGALIAKSVYETMATNRLNWVRLRLVLGVSAEVQYQVLG